MAQEGKDRDLISENQGYLEPWPPVRGEYRLGDPRAFVAVVTLASTFYPRGAAISGPCKTENLGLEKIVANVISNSNIRVLIICGMESKGHLPGNTLLALHKNGIDENGKIIGSAGAIPFIQNLSRPAIERFQRQIELIDRIGLEDTEEIEELISCYNLSSRPYPEEPFQVIKRRAARREILSVDSDLFFGSGVNMDTTSWLVASEV